ncbi:FMN-binding glutamate synthase family protein [Kroppenstedtia guangzhouensis]|uniref:FMN-binding glutamate synthase family protein n=1 Tax=Kroppenstedtia guangzhouensis TaxID=1274356 RepID=A0ABQ1G0P4_9BACL|nr:FMN-binding glutamate synthase family protein [Kroppenstedtia guangzhouensis]GGA33147.1 FMN-binding glutamate synthase family protein [Kroppenstedtia guangzhouensis]
MNDFWQGFAVTLPAVLVVAGLAALFSRNIIQRIFGSALRSILTETYSKNLMEIFSSGRRFHTQNIVEMALRSETDQGIHRSLGTPYPEKGWDRLMFLPAQLAVMPTKEHVKIDTRTVIGPRASRPLKLDIPLMVGGLGPGPTLSGPMKEALAKGARAVGTATHTGESVLTESERKEADKVVVQYGRADWNQPPGTLEQADMIEIVAGSGATSGTPFTILKVPGSMRQLLGLNPGEPLKIQSRVPGVNRPEDWRELVARLREMGKGVPVGIKLVPSRIEADLAQALDAGVDFITIDGAGSGVKESAPILQDDFGLPTIRGLVRAVRYLEKHYVRHKVSLIVSGGLHTPGDYLKALALGADAVALDLTVVMGAVHTQITKVLPWEPPSGLLWYDGKFADQLDVEKAAKCVANLFNSSVEEMKLATIALGKKSLGEINREDLTALDPLAREITGLPLAYEAQSR